MENPLKSVILLTQRSGLTLCRRACWVAVMTCAGSASPLQAESDALAIRAREILTENCYACHGPDAGSRQADLRLDLRDAAQQSFAEAYHQ